MRCFAACLMLAALVFPALCGAQGTTGNQEPWDVVIRGGRIVDGTGNPWFEGDVAIRGDRIAAIGKLGEDAPARKVIDARGLDRRTWLHRHPFPFRHDLAGGRRRPEQDSPGSHDRGPGRGLLGRTGQGQAQARPVRTRRHNR